MKLFNEIRSTKNSYIITKKVDGIQIGVEKDRNKFVAVVDGDRLDSYNTKKEAEKAAIQFVKQFKAQRK